VVGVGEVALPHRRGGKAGAVTAEDVGEYRGRLARLGPFRAVGPPLAWVVSRAFPAQALVAAESGCRTGAGPRVGRPRGGGDHERQVGVGAAGHRRV
jgi:hypothetical protein